MGCVNEANEIAELHSLGVDVSKTNDLNSKEELHALAENIKGSMYQDYKLAFSEEGDMHKAEAESTVKI